MLTSPPSPDETIHRLRRRLWVERGLFGAAIVALAAGWGISARRPGTWAVYVNGRPVVAMRDPQTLSRLLEQIKHERAGGSEGVEFLQPVRIDRCGVGEAALVDVAAARKRLEPALKLRARRGVIYVNDLPAVALPTARAANGVLERVKTDFAQQGEGTVEAAPTFQEKVEVREESAEDSSWADEETAVALLKGDAATGDGRHSVVRGDNAWSIGRRYDLTQAELRALNPGVNLTRLRVGQSLAVAKEAGALVTVVTESTVTQEIRTPFPVTRRPSLTMYLGKQVVKRPGRPGRARATYRIRFENGRLAAREEVSREPTADPRPALVIVGAKRRPRR
jgi:LysM repeat protein